MFFYESDRENDSKHDMVQELQRICFYAGVDCSQVLASSKVDNNLKAVYKKARHIDFRLQRLLNDGFREKSIKTQDHPAIISML
jgi:hypothetical protein